MTEKRKYSDSRDVETLLDYIPQKNKADRIEKFIDSLENLEPNEALARVNKYIKFWIKKGVLAEQTSEEFSERKQEYDESVNGDFTENYEKQKFVGKGYNFIEEGESPSAKVFKLKMGSKFRVPKETNDKGFFKDLFVGNIQILLYEFYAKYEKAIKETIKKD